MSAPPTLGPIAVPLPASPAGTPTPPWRACVAQTLRCWFGGILLLIVTLPMFALGNVLTMLLAMLPFLAVMAAIAVVSTLAALVIESLTARQVPVGGHIGLIGLAGLIVVGLFSLDIWFAIGGLIVCLVAATLGALVTIGDPSWRRYVIALAAAFLIFSVQSLLPS